MAENGVITIKFVEGSDKTPGPKEIQNEGTNPDVSSSVTGATNGESFKSSVNTALKTYVIQKTVSAIKQVVTSQINYQMNIYLNMNDNYLAQQQLNVAKGIVGKLTSIGVAAAALGPTGAVVAGGIMLIQTGFDIYHNKQQENINIAKMDAQLQFSRQRAGYSLTAESIGENR